MGRPLIIQAELRAARAALDGDDQDSNFSGTPIASRVVPNARGAVTTKSARAHAKSYRPGPPIVPQMIVNSLLHYTQKLSIRKREPFVERLCRYWSLKREARRGAPLLKRLHLEVSYTLIASLTAAVDGVISVEATDRCREGN